MGFNLKSKRCRVNGSSPIINLIIFYTGNLFLPKYIVICSLIQMCDCFGDPSNPPFSVSGAFVQNDLGAREVAGMESRLVLDISLYPPSGYYSTGEVVSGQCLLNMDNLFQSLVDVSNHVECFTTTVSHLLYIYIYMYIYIFIPFRMISQLFARLPLSFEN